MREESHPAASPVKIGKSIAAPSTSAATKCKNGAPSQKKPTERVQEMDWLEVQNLPDCGGESTTMVATAMKNKRSASFCEDNSVDLLCHENFSDYSSLFDDD